MSRAKTSYIVLNGFPGVGKSSIGTELCRLLPNARLFHNHLLIDAAAALYDRSDPAYQPLRHDLRQAIFRSLETSLPLAEAQPQYIIFTEAQTTSAGGPDTMREYLDSATRANIRLVSVILNCNDAENERRLENRAAALQAGDKLKDVGILRAIRGGHTIFDYGGEAYLEIRIDTSKGDAGDAAGEILLRLQAKEATGDLESSS